MNTHHDHVPEATIDHTSAHHGRSDQHAGHSPAMFRDRFWLTLALTVPLVVTSEMIQDWFGYRLDLPGTSWYGPVLGSVVFWWGGWPFLVGAGRELRARQPGMMLLIGMALVVAYGSSFATSLEWLDMEFWWELGALVTVMLLGHWQEMKAIGQAHGALAALAALLPDEAEVVDGDDVRSVTIEDLAVGDVVLVRPGGRVPADGTIVAGTATFDESMITGESRPLTRDEGDRVVAGTVSTDSSVRVRIDAVGDDTALAGIQRLVAEAQASRSRAQVLADRFAAVLFYAAVAAAAITFAAWTAIGDVDGAISRTVTVLVIACPHALGLAIPLVIAISTSVAAEHGILVKDRLALERMRLVDVVLFDKTGTLTEGAPVVTGITPADGFGEADVARWAAGVEQDSEHPVGRAIVAAAAPHGGAARATDVRSLPGRGVEATIDGATFAVGGPALLRERGVALPDELRGTVETWRARGAGVLHLVRDGRIVAAFAVEDGIRPESDEAVRELRDEHIDVAMITGDAQQVAQSVGRRLGITEIFAEVLPADKADAVDALHARDQRVAMVGDGVNDAPALARADVGLAIGAGTDVAIESAGVILAGSDPRGVAAVVRLSRASYRKMVQNLAWAAGYNIVAIPLAAGALAWAGIDLSPAVGAVLMSVSTVVVALNAQLLRRVRLAPGPTGHHPDRLRSGHRGGAG